MLGIRHHRNVAVDLYQGDITAFVCDAMVNAANAALAGGGGVDAAIHRVGGPLVMADCRRVGSCPTGSAVITTAGDLPCRYVIHAVGPVWQGGEAGEAGLLHSAYKAALQLGVDHQLRHLALAAISTGAYGYPLAAAAEIAITAVRDSIEESPNSAVKRITFVVFSAEVYRSFQDALFRNFPE